MVTWVSPSFEGNKLRRRSHFRVMPFSKGYDIKQHFEQEEASRLSSIRESVEHRTAKELVAAELNRRLNAGIAMPWWFKDENASDFSFSGDLLLVVSA
jgi:hypothetical protein